MDKEKYKENSRRKFFKITNFEVKGKTTDLYFLKDGEPYSFAVGNFNRQYNYMLKSENAIFQATSVDAASKMFFNRMMDNATPIALEHKLKGRTLVEREYYKQFITFDLEEVSVLPQLDGSLRDQNQPSRVIEHDYIIVNNQI